MKLLVRIKKDYMIFAFSPSLNLMLQSTFLSFIITSS